MTSEADVAGLIAALCKAAGWPSAPRFERFDHGMSGDLTVRIDGERPAFAKIGDPARRIGRESLAHEVAAMRWLDSLEGAFPVASDEATWRAARHCWLKLFTGRRCTPWRQDAPRTG